MTKIELANIKTRMAARSQLKVILGRRDFLNNCQNIHTPYSLCYEQIERLEKYTLTIDKDFLVFNIEYIEVLLYDFGVAKERIWFVTDCKQKAALLGHPRYKGVNVEIVSFDKEGIKNMKPFNGKKFDYVMGNPPYQAPSKNDNKGAGNCLWGEFVKKSFQICKENGFVSLIHPSGWRNVGGNFKNINKVLTAKQIRYLEIHNADDGIKTFNAGTRYDWYIAQNCPVSESTIVKGEDGIQFEIELSEIGFIPNGMFKEIKSLFAKNPEDRIHFIYNCSYHTVSGPVSSVKDEIYKYPCLQNISSKDDKPSCVYYSSTKEKGHFGTPKVIFGVQVSGVFIDKKGEYGMCEHCSAIVDDVDNLDNIKIAMKSDKFIELMKMCDVGGNRDRYNRKIIALFRKDFWKEFI